MPYKDRESYNKYMRKYMLERYHRRRAEALLQLGNQCVSCGVSGNEEALQFHHKDPDNKEFTIAKHSSASEKRFWAEVAKCVLLCEDCHILIHSTPL